MVHWKEWTAYLVGAFLTLGWKLIRYVRTEKKKGIKGHDAVMEWFFEDSIENTASWVTTIGAVWVVGAVYISRITWFDWLNAVPLHVSIAFFFGGLMELVAPKMVRNIVTWVVSKVPGGTP